MSGYQWLIPDGFDPGCSCPAPGVWLYARCPIHGQGTIADAESFIAYGNRIGARRSDPPYGKAEADAMRRKFLRLRNHDLWAKAWEEEHGRYPTVEESKIWAAGYDALAAAIGVASLTTTHETE